MFERDPARPADRSQKQSKAIGLSHLQQVSFRAILSEGVEKGNCIVKDTVLQPLVTEQIGKHCPNTKPGQAKGRQAMGSAPAWQLGPGGQFL